jgi:hypothetical protein
MRTHIISSCAFVTTADNTAVGLIVARAADVGTIHPDPIVDTDVDWMLNTRWLANASGAAADTFQERVIDNRSKRKMDELGMAYLLVLRNQNAAAQTYRVFARTLIALP